MSVRAHQLKEVIRSRYEQTGLRLKKAISRKSVCVSLEEYFEGNDGTNCFPLGGSPFDFEGARNALFAIRERAHVQDVVMAISHSEFDDPQAWPSADTAYVITSCSCEEVESWLPADFAQFVESVDEGFWCNEAPIGTPAIAPGNKVIKVWWG